MKRALRVGGIASVGAALVIWIGVALARLYERGPDTLYNEQTIAVMRRALGSADNGVDVGAYIGTLTAGLVDAAPNGSHYAIEPQPEYARRLTKLFPSVTVLAVALGDTTGTLPFLLARADPARSGLRPQDYPTVGQRIDTIQVPVRRLDDVVDSTRRIAFIKMDVEGAEYGVLRGARRTILRDRPVIVLEFGTVGMDSFGITPEMMWALLHDDLGMDVALMRSWLTNGVPFTRDEFLATARARQEWMYVASPRRD